jgi:anti-sigma B factor antagonist
MKLIAEKLGNVLVIRVEAEHLDAGNVKDFKRETTALVEAGARVVLDLAPVQFVDSSGCGAILSFLKQLRGEEGNCGSAA